MKRLSIIALTLMLLALAGSGVWYFSIRDNQQPSGNKAQPSQNQAQSKSNPSQTSTVTNENNKSYPLLVYFSKHPTSDNEPGKTFPVKRTSPDSGVATYSISQLLRGPSATESSQGYFATARLRDGSSPDDFKLSIGNEVATLQFLKPFDHSGVVADGQAESEIKATLTQFSTVKKVIILNYQGDCEFNLSGQNLCKQ